jgi:flagellar hook-length control protein FliK
VSVQVRDGNISASFQTSNEQATRLLSHSLAQLKGALESAGMTVEKLQVSQTARENSHQGGDSSDSHQRTAQDSASRQQQQRRELLRRMWQKLSGDPLDLVA